MKFAISTVLLPELSDRKEIVSKVKSAGYDGIEWRVQSDYHIDPRLVEKEAKEISHICEDHALKIVCLATYLKWDELDKIEGVLNGAKTMKCPRIRMAGFNYDGSRNYHEIYNEALERIDKAQDLFKKVGVTGCIETHFGTIHASAHGAYNVVRKFNPQVIGVILDASNLIIEGWENWKMIIELLGNYLDHVHARNAEWGYSNEKGWHWKWAPLASGMANWKEILKILRDKGYQGYITNENIHGVPTSSKGYIGEAHKSLGGYDEYRSIDERLADLRYLKSLLVF